jgi:hypothetical protein
MQFLQIRNVTEGFMSQSCISAPERDGNLKKWEVQIQNLRNVTTVYRP